LTKHQELIGYSSRRQRRRPFEGEKRGTIKKKRPRLARGTTSYGTKASQTWGKQGERERRYEREDGAVAGATIPRPLHWYYQGRKDKEELLRRSKNIKRRKQRPVMVRCLMRKKLPKGRKTESGQDNTRTAWGGSGFGTEQGGRKELDRESGVLKGGKASRGPLFFWG